MNIYCGVCCNRIKEAEAMRDLLIEWADYSCDELASDKLEDCAECSINPPCLACRTKTLMRTIS